MNGAELFAAWRWASSRCLDPRCSFCNPRRELVLASSPAFALATRHGRRSLS